jgi:CDP-paratose 2-epimerase
MKILVTGGAGFIGTNVAEFYASRGDNVIVFDNLSRAGAWLNLSYLIDQYSNIEFIHGDIRNQYDIFRVFKGHSFDVIFHLAAQVAVTTSVQNPREDFEINALGTFNLLEVMKEVNSQALLIYASTNKVYGGMEDLPIVEENGRYKYRDLPQGVSEVRILDFHSPYGCSKGAAEQYVRDYSRIYDLKTVVFRMSCIYGYRQFGIEDQGWVAWFTIASTFGKKITIYGDGKQVRDVLFIDDLVRVYDLAVQNADFVNGRVYNIGGGDYQMSLLELLDYLATHIGVEIPVTYSDWRPGDQPVYVSNISKAKKELNWQPVISVEDGVQRLYRWVKEEKGLFKKVGLI